MTDSVVLPHPQRPSVSRHGMAATAYDRATQAAGGDIIRRHSEELPWIQIELNRTTTMSPSTKRAHLLEALSRFGQMIISLKEYAR